MTQKKSHFCSRDVWVLHSHMKSQRMKIHSNYFFFTFKVYFIWAFKTKKAVYPVLHKWDLAICYIAIWFCLSCILTIKHLLKTLLVKPFLNNCSYYLLIVIHLHN